MGCEDPNKQAECEKKCTDGTCQTVKKECKCVSIRLSESATINENTIKLINIFKILFQFSKLKSVFLPKKYTIPIKYIFLAYIAFDKKVASPSGIKRYTTTNDKNPIIKEVIEKVNTKSHACDILEMI